MTLRLEGRMPAGIAGAVKQTEWLLTGGLIAVVSAIAFAPVADVLISQWSSNDTYSFGILVPLISAYLVWLRRERVKQLAVVPSPFVGTLCIAFCAALLVFGRLVGVIGIQQIAMVLMVPALIWLLCGRRFVLALWFPILYLFLMLPIWEFFTDRFQYQSQLLSANLADRLLGFVGVPVHRQATFLELPNITLEVASLCSGVNFLIAVITIAVPQAYMFVQGYLPRAIVIVFAVTVAFLSNSVRIAIIGVLAYYEISNQVHGPGHVLQGLFVSGVGLIALQIAVAYMARKYPKPQREPALAEVGPVTTSVPRRGLSLSIAVAAVLLLVGGGLPIGQLVAASPSGPAFVPDTLSNWRLTRAALPTPFVTGGHPNLAQTFSIGSQIVDVYVGNLTYADPQGALAYRQITIPSQGAVSEMPIALAGGTAFVNSVTFRTGNRDTDVVFWYSLRGAVTSQVTTAKFGAVWSLVSGNRPMPLLVVVSRTRVVNTPQEPMNGVISELMQALQAGPLAGGVVQESSIVRPLEMMFWMAAGAVAYIYAGYPLVVFLGAKLRRRQVVKRTQEPTISVLIAAHNEVAHIGRTLDNTLALDYDAAKLQIIVVSDGSTDGTDEVVQGYQDRGVMLLRQEPRNGKTAALNQAVQHATGELLVFADANSLYEKAALRHLASNFADPSVGYVTGKLGYRNRDGSLTGDGCSLYMRYENFIRTCESDLGSLVGVNGGIDAVRRSLYVPMKPDDLPDLVLPLLVVARGFRVVYEPAALLTEEANDNTRDEYRMRVRVSLRALWTLADMSGMLSVRRHGFYAIQLLSHKALRYLAFAFMVVAFTTSALLIDAGLFYKFAFLAQVVFAVGASLGFLAERYGYLSPALAVPYYFMLVNVAALQACVKFLKGERHRVWSPRVG